MTIVQSKLLLLAFRTLYLFSPKDVVINLFLMLLQGATAGIGILLLVPMLSLIGLQSQAPLNGQLTNILGELFDLFSAPLNLASVLILYVMILSTVAFTQYLLTVRISRIQQQIVCYFRNLLHQSLLRTSWRFILSNKMSDFNYSLTQQIQSMGTALQLLLLVLSQTVMILVYSVLIFVLSWKISIAAFALTLVLFLLVRPFNKRIYSVSEKRILSVKTIFQIIGEQLSSIKMIKSYAAEEHFLGKLRVAGVRLEKEIVEVTNICAQSKLINMISSVLFIALLFYISVVWFNVALTTLLLVILVFSKLLPNISQALNTSHQLLSELPSIKDINDSIQTCNNNSEVSSSKIKQDNRNNHKNNNFIEFKDIFYRYPDKEHFALENLSFGIKANQTTLFSGPSGAGKTTAVDLLMGLLIPTQGTISCDGVDLNGEHLLPWRKKIAYVTQEIHLFHQSIRDNLSWVKENVTDQDIWIALEQAAAKEFVEKLPDGLDTFIGDKGIKISGGERQRLALARALLLRPRLLILDEATSALDKDNERRIRDALANLKGNLTIIIIAHARSNTLDVDSVIHFGALEVTKDMSFQSGEAVH